MSTHKFNEDRLFKTIVGLWFVWVLIVLGLVAVAVWAVIKLVTHFTS